MKLWSQVLAEFWFTPRLPLTSPTRKVLLHFYRTQCHRTIQKQPHPEASVNFPEFSQECSGKKSTTTSAEERGKLQAMTKVYKAHYGSPRRERKEVQEFPYIEQLPPPRSCLFCAPQTILEPAQKNWENAE